MGSDGASVSGRRSLGQSRLLGTSGEAGSRRRRCGGEIGEGQAHRLGSSDEPLLRYDQRPPPRAAHPESRDRDDLHMDSLDDAFEGVVRKFHEGVPVEVDGPIYHQTWKGMKQTTPIIFGGMNTLRLPSSSCNCALVVHGCRAKA